MLFYTELFNVVLFWLHIQMYWRVCCISEYIQGKKWNWGSTEELLINKVAGPFFCLAVACRPQCVRLLSWETDPGSGNNKLDPSTSRDLLGIVSYNVFLQPSSLYHNEAVNFYQTSDKILRKVLIKIQTGSEHSTVTRNSNMWIYIQHLEKWSKVYTLQGNKMIRSEDFS